MFEFTEVEKIEDSAHVKRIVKLDRELVRNVGSDKVRQSILKNCLNMFDDLNITALAEGIETYDEYIWLKDAGIELMQGYYFAKPDFESLPSVDPSLY